MKPSEILDCAISIAYISSKPLREAFPVGTKQHLFLACMEDGRIEDSLKELGITWLRCPDMVIKADAYFEHLNVVVHLLKVYGL